MGILSQALIDFDDEIVEEFLAHFEVMKDAMQPAILDLEKPEQYTDRVNELFRIFHNLKSASAYLKFEVINRMSSMVENVLEMARAKEGPADEQFVDWLLKVSDQFGAWYLNLSNNDERFAPIDFTIFDTSDLAIMQEVGKEEEE